MSNLRLHAGNASHGCVTVPGEDWLAIQNMLNTTSQGSPVIIQGKSYPNYGTLRIIGSGFGTRP